MKYLIFCNGKNTGNGPFSSREEALAHVEKLRKFALSKSKQNSKYKNSFENLDELEIVEVSE